MNYRRSPVPVSLILPVLILLPGFLAAEDFQFSADSLSSQFTEGEKRTVLSGSAQIISGPTTIEAPSIELYGPDFRYAEAEGGVSIEDSEQGFNSSAESLYYDREEKNSRIRGNAILKDMENGVIVKGEFLENRQETQLTTIQINVRIFKDDIVARCSFARYRRKDDILELTGRPEVYKGDNEYRADRIIIDLETDEIYLRGRVRGEMTSKTEESQPEEETP